ncbi:TetR family transcriptional regulator C-terminal domain-containing protein [Nonomuraea sp. NPDC049784]|uniref:TetR/AcrR family transcriptional regulator n=1 Tax=Nonomuraea sp. NPDC049784 TaxID=3154361 RepID=UPI0033E1EDF4
MSRRQEIADVAIRLIAAEGMRGLTHRAVDRAADLPEGSTSYYFRTRQALVCATAERLADHTAAELAELESSLTNLDDLVEAAAGLVGQWLTTGRDRQLARYELSLEATRRPELRQALLAGRARLRDMVTRLLDASGVPDADLWAGDLIAYVDGLVLDSLLRPGDRPAEAPDLRPKIRTLLAAAGQG